MHGDQHDDLHDDPHGHGHHTGSSDDQHERYHRENKALILSLHRKIDSLKTVIEGPSGKPELGLVFKHIWLEKSVSRVGKLFWAALVGAATAIGAAIISLTHARSGPGN